jgi:hypothetical protein
MITLTEENLKAIENFAQELPTKYGNPLLSFFAELIKAQTPEKEDNES